MGRQHVDAAQTGSQPSPVWVFKIKKKRGGGFTTALKYCAEGFLSSYRVRVKFTTDAVHSPLYGRQLFRDIFGVKGNGKRGSLTKGRLYDLDLLQMNNKASKSRAHQDTWMHRYKSISLLARRSWAFEMMKQRGGNKKQRFHPQRNAVQNTTTVPVWPFVRYFRVCLFLNVYQLTLDSLIRWIYWQFCVAGAATFTRWSRTRQVQLIMHTHLLAVALCSRAKQVQLCCCCSSDLSCVVGTCWRHKTPQCFLLCSVLVQWGVSILFYLTGNNYMTWVEFYQISITFYFNIF